MTNNMQDKNLNNQQKPSKDGLNKSNPAAGNFKKDPSSTTEADKKSGQISGGNRPSSSTAE